MVFGERNGVLTAGREVVDASWDSTELSNVYRCTLSLESSRWCETIVSEMSSKNWVNQLIPRILLQPLLSTSTGISLLFRKLVLALPAVMHVSFDGNTNKVTVDCEYLRMFHYLISFKLEEEFDERTFTGEVVRSLVKRESDRKWIQCQLTGKHKGLTIYREMIDDNLCKIVSLIGKFP